MEQTPLTLLMAQNPQTVLTLPILAMVQLNGMVHRIVQILTTAARVLHKNN